jgi:hypothetical protein
MAVLRFKHEFTVRLLNLNAEPFAEPLQAFES